MDQFAKRRSTPGRALAGVLALGVVMTVPGIARADEGGVSIPGFFGSLAASPLVPGFSLATIYYHGSVSAGGDVAFAAKSIAAISPRISPAT